MRLNPRLVVSSLVLILLLAGAAALALRSDMPRGGAGIHRVIIEGPEGILFDGEVFVEEASAISALEVAAAEAGLTLEVERYGAMGAYVRAIGPHRASGPSGWIFETQDGEEWRGGDRSAEDVPLTPGQSVRWRWVKN